MFGDMEKMLLTAQIAILKTPCMSAANISAGLAKSSTLPLERRVEWAAKAAVLSAVMASDPLIGEVAREQKEKVTVGLVDDALLGVLIDREENESFPGVECANAIRELYELPPLGT